MNPRVLGSTQSASDYTVSYYLTAADALAGTPSACQTCIPTLVRLKPFMCE
jgi:hypothetical protein